MSSAALQLHVALSLRLDAIEAYRLAHAYRDEELHKLADRFEGYGGRLLTGEQVAALIRGGKDTGTQPPAGESTQPTPSFFQPDHTYTRGRWSFHCLADAPSPTTGLRTALGYLTRTDGTCTVHALDQDDWDNNSWTEGEVPRG